MKVLRSIGAVLAGFVAVFVLAIVTDVVLVMAGVLPDMTRPELYSDGLYVLITFYTALYSAVGGWLTARLAPSRPMTHALALGALGMLASILGAVANWKQAAGHEWYPIALIVLAIPACWVGGFLYMKKAGASVKA